MTNHIDSIVEQLQKQKVAIERALEALQEIGGGTGVHGGFLPDQATAKRGRATKKVAKRRPLSAEARERIAAAQRARWAKARKEVKRAKKAA